MSPLVWELHTICRYSIMFYKVDLSFFFFFFFFFFLWFPVCVPAQQTPFEKLLKVSAIHYENSPIEF